MKKAIIVCDFVNEIVNPEGKFKGKGYADFAKSNNVLINTVKALKVARKNNYRVIFIKVGFSEDYREQPKRSLLFGKANEYQALKLGTWATDVVNELNIMSSDYVLVKHRISPFYATSLDMILKNENISDIYICGCATDLVVSSTARDAHDRDFKVFVLEDCCAASSMEDHQNALKAIKKIATVCSYEELLI